jgi:hypothetical protein
MKGICFGVERCLHEMTKKVEWMDEGTVRRGL